jgi:ribonuclease Y
MPAAADQSFIAAVTFSCGAIAAYSIAKWHENSRGAMREAKLRAEVELARREAALEAAELRAEAEDEKRVAARLAAEAASQAKVAETLRDESGRERERLTSELQRLAGLTAEQARHLTIETLRREMGEEVRLLRHELLDQAEQEVADEARRKLLSAMQRLTTQTTQDATSVLVFLPNEEMKGRIVGREGRNIRTFEQATGATLLIDDTPGQVLVSCFDPVRREVARIALERIVKDGRITPSLIEENVRNAADEVVRQARRLGRDAVRGLGLPPMDETVEELLGRLHFRLWPTRTRWPTPSRSPSSARCSRPRSASTRSPPSARACSTTWARPSRPRPAAATRSPGPRCCGAWARTRAS